MIEIEAIKIEANYAFIAQKHVIHEMCKEGCSVSPQFVVPPSIVTQEVPFLQTVGGVYTGCVIPQKSSTVLLLDGAEGQIRV